MSSTHKKAGITLIEVLVGILITALIGLAVYSILSHARYVAATTAAKGDAKQEAQLIMRYLSRDISNSRAKVDYAADKDSSVINKTLNFSAGNLSLEIPKAFAEDEKITHFDAGAAQDDTIYSKVEYTLSGKTMTRKGEMSRILSQNIKDFKMAENYDGKIQVNLTVEKPVIGFGSVVKHSESAIILIREAEKFKGDKSWRQRLKPGEY